MSARTLGLPAVARQDRLEGRTLTPVDRGGTSQGDDDLLHACARGDGEAFAHLLSRHRDRVFQLVRWWVAGSAAEDVAQEVFLQVFRSAASFAGRSSFKTWLYGLTLNVCRRHRRRAARGLGTDEEALRELRASSLDPLARLEAAERAAIVRRAVESLPLAQRTVLLLREWEDMTYSEIATVMKVPVGTVRSRLHNARVVLADGLEQLRGEV
jgi:RNA polymerase sigma-70 factor (ECF subfamily)